MFWLCLKKKEKFARSYSQSGEDMIIDFIFKCRGINRPSYVDIGAHDPFYLSNTAYFYEKGCRGINIEPNPVLFKNFLSYRKKDVNLNIGIGDSEATLDFYIMDNPTMSTFSKDQADELTSKFSFKIADTLKVKVQRIKDVIKKYSGGVFPDFLTLDAEGLDLDILKTIDYENNYPKVICVETATYEEDGTNIKETEVIDYIKNNGYIVFADTFVNTIFVRENFWIRNK